MPDGSVEEPLVLRRLSEVQWFINAFAMQPQRPITYALQWPASIMEIAELQTPQRCSLTSMGNLDQYPRRVESYITTTRPEFRTKDSFIRGRHAHSGKQWGSKRPRARPGECANDNR